MAAGPTLRTRSTVDVTIIGATFQLIPILRDGDPAGARLGAMLLSRKPRQDQLASLVELLRRTGARFVPALQRAEITDVRGEPCLVTNDGGPILGPVPGLGEELLIAAAVPSSLAPGAAAQLCDHIVNRTDISAPYRASRFGGREEEGER